MSIGSHSTSFSVDEVADNKITSASESKRHALQLITGLEVNSIELAQLWLLLRDFTVKLSVNTQIGRIRL